MTTPDGIPMLMGEMTQGLTSRWRATGKPMDTEGGGISFLQGQAPWLVSQCQVVSPKCMYTQSPLNGLSAIYVIYYIFIYVERYTNR